MADVQTDCIRHNDDVFLEPVSNEGELLARLQEAAGLNKKVLIKSGDRKVLGPRDEGAAIINLSGFSKIEDLGNNLISVESGVTVGQLSAWLEEKEKFLSLPLTSSRAMGGVGHDKRDLGLLPKSLGSLYKFKKSTKNVDLGCAACDEGKEDECITLSSTFETVPFAELEQFTIAREVVGYTKGVWSKVVKNWVGVSQKEEFAEVDFAMFVFSGHHAFPVLVLVASARNEKATHTVLENVLQGVDYGDGEAFEALKKRKVFQGGAKAMRMMDKLRSIESVLPGAHYSGLVELDDAFVDSVDTVIFEGTTKAVEEGEFAAQYAAVQSVPKSAEEGGKTMAARFSLTAPRFLNKPLGDTLQRSTLKTMGVSKAAPLVAAVAAKSAPIPGFQGDVFQKEDGKIYDQKRQQYATSSYEGSKTHPMSPKYIAYPQTDEDVIAACNFCKENNLRLVARSGGHQYSGLSSGGDETLQLSMEDLVWDSGAHPKVRPSEGSTYDCRPAIKLQDAASKFMQFGVTIPHGECPFVNLGGHIQSGGYGHLLHNFGLAIDYVSELDVVAFNKEGKAEKMTLKRSAAEGTDEKKMLRSVLGGGANSFGVLTRIQLSPLRDADYDKTQPKKSGGFQGLYKYSKEGFAAVLAEAQKMSAADLSHNDEIDLDCTIISSDGFSRPFNTMLVEIVTRDFEATQSRLKAFIDGVEKAVGFVSRRINSLGCLAGAAYPLQLKELSHLSYSFVRTSLAKHSEGREFVLPYHKRVNATKQPLSDEYITTFSNHADVTVESKGLKMVYQHFLGGGEYYTNKGGNIAHRDARYGVVYDVFYKDKKNWLGQKTGTYEEEALKRQADYTMHLLPLLNPDGAQEVRVQWGSFGEQIDMNKETTRALYYDNEKQYAGLQEVKDVVDPQNVFGTVFTVQPSKKE